MAGANDTTVTTILVLDASGATAGAGEFDAAMNKVSDSAKKGGEGATTSMARLATQFDRMAASADPVIKAQQQLEKVTKASAAAVALNRATQGEANETIGHYKNNLQDAISAAELARVTQDRFRQSVALGSTQVLSLTHAVRSMIEGFIIGAPPTQILAQQFSHLSYAATGPEGIIGQAPKMGTAIKNFILGPSGAAAAALIALSVAGVAGFIAMSAQARAVAAELEKAGEISKTIADELKLAGDAVGRYAGQLQHLAEVQAANEIERLNKALKEQNDLIKSNSSISLFLNGASAAPAPPGAFVGGREATPEESAASERLRKTLSDSSGNARDLRDALLNMFEAADRATPATKATKDYEDSLLALLDPAVQLQDKIDALYQSTHKFQIEMAKLGIVLGDNKQINATLSMSTQRDAWALGNYRDEVTATIKQLNDMAQAQIDVAHARSPQEHADAAADVLRATPRTEDKGIADTKIDNAAMQAYDSALTALQDTEEQRLVTINHTIQALKFESSAYGLTSNSADAARMKFDILTSVEEAAAKAHVQAGDEAFDVFQKTIDQLDVLIDKWLEYKNTISDEALARVSTQLEGVASAAAESSRALSPVEKALAAIHTVQAQDSGEPPLLKQLRAIIAARSAYGDAMQQITDGIRSRNAALDSSVAAEQFETTVVGKSGDAIDAARMKYELESAVREEAASKNISSSSREFAVYQKEIDYIEEMVGEWLKYKSTVTDVLVSTEMQKNAAIAAAQQLQSRAKSPAELAEAARALATAQNIGSTDDTRIQQQRVELAATGALSDAQYKLAEAYETRRRSAAQTLKDAQLDVQLLGQGVAQTETLRYAQQQLSAVMEEAAQNHTQVSQAEIAAINSEASAYGGLRQQLAEASVVQDVFFERQQIGMSEIDRTVAQTLHDLYGTEWQSHIHDAIADQIRLNGQLEKAASRAEDFASAVGDAFGDMFTKPVKDFEDFLDRITQGFARISQELISSGIRDLILGRPVAGLSGILGGSRAAPSTNVSISPSAPIPVAISSASTADIGKSVGTALDPFMEAIKGGYSLGIGGAVVPGSSAVPVASVGMTSPGALLGTVRSAGGKTAQVSAVMVDAFQGFINDLEASGYKINAFSGFRDHARVAGTGTPSYHGEGTALDINPAQNPRSHSGVITNLPSNVEQMAAQWGLMWGGKWNYPDPMHFEYTRGVNRYDQSVFTGVGPTGVRNGAAIPAQYYGQQGLGVNAPPAPQGLMGAGNSRISGFMQSPAGQGLMAGIGGFSTGYQSQSPLLGAAGGALSGLMSGGITGALIGGLGGLIGGIVGKAVQAKKDLEAAKQAWDDMHSSLMAFERQLSDAGPLGDAINSAQDQMQKFIDAARKAGQPSEEIDKLQRELDDFIHRQIRDFTRGFDIMVNAMNMGLGANSPAVQAASNVLQVGVTIRKFLDDVRTAAKEMGQDEGPALDKARRAAVQYSLSLLDSAADLTTTQRRYLEIQGTASQLSGVLQDLGLNADEAGKVIREKVSAALADLATDFSTGLSQRYNEAIGKSYINSVNNLLEQSGKDYNDAILLGVNPGQVAKTFAGEAQAIVDSAGLTGTAFTDFLTMFPQLTGVVHQATSAVDDQIQYYKDLTKTLQEYLDQLNQSDLSPLSPQGKLDTARTAFNAQLALAQTGDKDALSSITQYSDDFLTAARAFYASTQEYTDIFQQVTDEIRDLPTAAQAADPIIQAITDTSAEATQAAIAQSLAIVTQVGLGVAATDRVYGAIRDLQSQVVISLGGIGDSHTTVQPTTVASTPSSGGYTDSNGGHWDSYDDYVRHFNASADYSGGGGADYAPFARGGLIPHYARGGMVGNGIWNRDSVLARFVSGGNIMLAGGEHITRASSVTAATLPMLNRINTLGSTGLDDGADQRHREMMRANIAMHAELVRVIEAGFSGLRADVGELSRVLRFNSGSAPRYGVPSAPRTG